MTIRRRVGPVQQLQDLSATTATTTLTNFPGGDDHGAERLDLWRQRQRRHRGNGTLNGDAGNDTSWRLGAHNTILGGAGDDKLYGQGTLNGGSGKDTLENDVYGGQNTKMTGGTQADRFHVSFDDGTYEYHARTKVTITDFHHSEGDKLDFSSEHLNGESPYWGYYTENPGDLFATFDADKNGNHDGVIRIGDFSTSKSADGDLQLRYFGSMVELDGVHSISTVDWIHGT